MNKYGTRVRIGALIVLAVAWTVVYNVAYLVGRHGLGPWAAIAVIFGVFLILAVVMGRRL